MTAANEKVMSFRTMIYPTRREMGAAAARDASEVIRRLLEEKESINMIFAAAPSQNEFLEALVADESIDFSRIRAFHMDEYIGLPAQAPQAFGNFLKERIFGRRNFLAVELINGNAQDGDAEAARYAELLEKYPVDVVCMGIGENGHIAFNDPPVADFADPKLVKPIELDEISRRQQVNDGCFETLGDVPKIALTLTIPALMRAKHHFCVVPAATKAQAVRGTIHGEISTACPATVLRLAEDARLYLDADSASEL